MWDWIGELFNFWHGTLVHVTFAISLFILLPLSFIRSLRKYSSILLFLATIILGIDLWTMGLLYTYTLWGLWAVVIGLLFFGIGVVPMSILATLFKGMWFDLGGILLTALIVYGFRAYASWVWAKHKVENEERELALAQEFEDLNYSEEGK